LVARISMAALLNAHLQQLCQALDRFEKLVNFANDLRLFGTMNFAVSSSWPMMKSRVVINLRKNELPAVIPAEGPIFCVGLDHK
jgi:hypothetical protein